MSSAQTPDIAQAFNFKRLPVLPAGVPELLGALGDDNLGFVQLARELERFPSIVIRLIGLANSAWSAPISPITSLEMACNRLGLNVVRSSSIALAVAQPFNPNRCVEFEAKLYWSDALLTAEAAFALAQMQPQLGPQSMRTVGLLRNIGLLWAADTIPEQTGIALAQFQKEPQANLNQIMMNVCGVGYQQLGGTLAEGWGLPTSMTEIISRTPANAPDANLATLRLIEAAASLAGDLLKGEEPPEELQGYQLGRVNAVLAPQLERIKQLADSLFSS